MLSINGHVIDSAVLHNNDEILIEKFRLVFCAANAAVDDYDALVLPGGTANPDKLRMDDAAVSFVGDFVRSGNRSPLICHGPLTLVSAGVVKGRKLTSYPSVRHGDRRLIGGRRHRLTCRRERP